jgi:hypothetical protein
MNIKKFVESRKEWSNDDPESNMIFFCSGSMPKQLKDTIDSALNNYIVNGQIRKSKYMTVFGIIVELIQNVNNYCNNKEGSCCTKIQASSFVLIEELRGDFIISAGNLVENCDVDYLKTKIAQIDGLDKEALKKLYLEEVKKPFGLENHGAGLGFIDIARNTSEPLKFSFNKEDENFTFFTIEAIVKNS